MIMTSNADGTITRNEVIYHAKEFKFHG